MELLVTREQDQLSRKSLIMQTVAQTVGVFGGLSHCPRSPKSELSTAVLSTAKLAKLHEVKNNQANTCWPLKVLAQGLCFFSVFCVVIFSGFSGVQVLVCPLLLLAGFSQRSSAISALIQQTRPGFKRLYINIAKDNQSKTEQ